MALLKVTSLLLVRRPPAAKRRLRGSAIPALEGSAGVGSFVVMGSSLSSVAPSGKSCESRRALSPSPTAAWLVMERRVLGCARAAPGSAAPGAAARGPRSRRGLMPGAQQSRAAEQGTAGELLPSCLRGAQEQGSRNVQVPWCSSETRGSQVASHTVSIHPLLHLWVSQCAS